MRKIINSLIKYVLEHCIKDQDKLTRFVDFSTLRELTRAVYEEIFNAEVDTQKKKEIEELDRWTRQFVSFEMDRSNDREMLLYTAGSLSALADICNLMMDAKKAELDVDNVLKQVIDTPDEEELRGVLKMLGKNERMLQKDLAKKLELSPQNLANRFHRKSCYALLLAYESFGRTKMYYLTEMGKQVLSILQKREKDNTVKKNGKGNLLPYGAGIADNNEEKWSFILGKVPSMVEICSKDKNDETFALPYDSFYHELGLPA